MGQSDNFESANKARRARRLDPWTNRLEAAQLIKPPASRGVSDLTGCSAPVSRQCLLRDGKMWAGSGRFVVPAHPQVGFVILPHVRGVLPQSRMGFKRVAREESNYLGVGL